MKVLLRFGRAALMLAGGPDKLPVTVVPEEVLTWSAKLASALGVAELGISGPHRAVEGETTFVLYLLDLAGKPLIAGGLFAQPGYDRSAVDGELGSFKLFDDPDRRVELHWSLPAFKGERAGAGTGGGPDLPSEIRTVASHYWPILRAARPR